MAAIQILALPSYPGDGLELGVTPVPQDQALMSVRGGHRGYVPALTTHYDPRRLMPRLMVPLPLLRKNSDPRR